MFNMNFEEDMNGREWRVSLEQKGNADYRIAQATSLDTAKVFSDLSSYIRVCLYKGLAPINLKEADLYWIDGSLRIDERDDHVPLIDYASQTRGIEPFLSCYETVAGIVLQTLAARGELNLADWELDDSILLASAPVYWLPSLLNHRDYDEDDWSFVNDLNHHNAERLGWKLIQEAPGFKLYTHLFVPWMLKIYQADTDTCEFSDLSHKNDQVMRALRSIKGVPSILAVHKMGHLMPNLYASPPLFVSQYEEVYDLLKDFLLKAAEHHDGYVGEWVAPEMIQVKDGDLYLIDFRGFSPPDDFTSPIEVQSSIRECVEDMYLTLTDEDETAVRMCDDGEE